MKGCDDHRAAYLAGRARRSTHVDSCSDCAPMLDELDETRRFLKEDAAWEQAGPGLEDRVMAEVARPRRAARQPASPSPARRSPARARAARRWRLSIPRAAWGLAAAALVVGVLAGALISGSWTGDDQADVQIALSGTELAPRARADAELREDDNGVEIRLEVSGLPRAPEGSYYQAWVRGEAGLVPIGTFHTGRGEVVLWSGVSIERYDTITVTIEDEGGDAGSSGKRVLTGQNK